MNKVKMMMEMVHGKVHEKPDVSRCQCQCLIGDACERKICTGAYKLERLCPNDAVVCDRCSGVNDKPCADAKEPLPPCPFCGSHEVDSAMPMGSDWWVQCAACGAGSAIFNTEAEAEAAWRRREAKPEEATGTYVAECHKTINRLLEGLEQIAAMPGVDPLLNIPLAAVVSQYDEARETARLTLDQYARNSGIAADLPSVESGEVPHA